MRRNTLNLVIDAATLLYMLSMVATGMILRFVLPPGSGRQALTLWRWDRHDWGDIHFSLSISLVAILGLHLALHWNWVYATVSHRVLRRPDGCPPISLRRRNAIGMAFLAVVALAVGTFLVIAVQSTTSSGGRGRDGRGPPVVVERHASDFWGRH